MPVHIVLGTQWGDEGKGKVIDYMAGSFDFVVRYQGGNNAGHTVMVGNEVFVLHLLPSGVVHGNPVCIIGDGVVVDPRVLLEEIDALRARGFDTSRIFISPKAHLVMPYHRLIDAQEEEHKGERNIGTTRRGIGPCYADMVNRIGLRMSDLMHRAIFTERLRPVVERYNLLFKHIYHHPPCSLSAIEREYIGYGERLRPHVRDTTTMLFNALNDDKTILLEGAQGTALDIQHGTYPFVTSSSTISGGACIGAPIPPNRIDHIYGVAKAYTTRVGAGSFFTELHGVDCEQLRIRGGEFGATTGRARRCGWFDAALVRYATRINGLTDIVLTKLDILTGFERLKICNAYLCDGQIFDVLPADYNLHSRLRPRYEEMEGWSEPISAVKDFNDLPPACQAYVLRIEALVECPISLISVGPERGQSIVKNG